MNPLGSPCGRTGHTDCCARRRVFLHMSSKRPSPKAPSTSSEWSITDEWGIYDPAKAGMPALFARLGRPILQAAASNPRKERRRAQRPERSSEGVGMAIAEARRRAGIALDGDDSVEHPLAGGNPARAMRLALKAQAAVNAMGTPAAEPFVAPTQVPAPSEAVAARGADTPAVTPPKKRSRKAPARPAPDRAEAAVSAAETGRTPVASRRSRARKAASSGRTTQSAPAVVVAPAPVGPASASIPTPAPPAPSPRRPRGPVPLAAWAHSVADQPVAEPRRHNTLGFWRGIFRIPTEVALVEYAHGAKIHRLLIETADEPVLDFI